MKKSNFDKFPNVKVHGHTCIAGWTNIADTLQSHIDKIHNYKRVVAIECYHGVYTNELASNLKNSFPSALLIDAASAMRSKEEIEKLVYPFVTDDPVFGHMAPLNLADFFDSNKIYSLQNEVNGFEKGLVIIYGQGASLVSFSPDLLVYADMPRWEIQLRFRNNSISNLGDENASAEFSYQYKRSFFVDWRVCDRHKKIPDG